MHLNPQLIKKSDNRTRMSALISPTHWSVFPQDHHIVFAAYKARLACVSSLPRNWAYRKGYSSRGDLLGGRKAPIRRCRCRNESVWNLGYGYRNGVLQSARQGIHNNDNKKALKVYLKCIKVAKKIFEISKNKETKELLINCYQDTLKLANDLKINLSKMQLDYELNKLMEDRIWVWFITY